MASVACPKCGKHLTEFDVVCLNCSFVITPEMRAKLIKEQEDRILFEADLARRKVSNRHKEHKFQRMLNKMSLGLFGTGWTEMAVPFIVLLLIIIVIILMIL